jgi:hypothetical protein
MRYNKNFKGKWDAIAVIEEMSFFDKSYEMGRPAQQIEPSFEHWGFHYFFDDMFFIDTRNLVLENPPDQKTTISQ